MLDKEAGTHTLTSMLDWFLKQATSVLFSFFFHFTSVISHVCAFITGSPHANLNQNNLKYGTDNNRISTQIQEPTTPPQSPNKNSGQAEKIVLLVCNRACAGQQGRRYWTTLAKVWNIIPKNSLKLMQVKLFCFCNSCRFGNPFILYLERTVTWDVLQKEILEKMRHLLRPGVFVQVHTLQTYPHRHFDFNNVLIMYTFLNFLSLIVCR